MTRLFVWTQPPKRKKGTRFKNICLPRSQPSKPVKWNSKTQQKMAWPWTINVRGKGHYYKTKEAAVAAAKAFRKRGIKSLDVGCMQINMKFHGHEFASLEEAFDPQTNVEYAARFLKRLYDRRQDWMKAATDYHSKTEKSSGLPQKLLAAPRNRQKRACRLYNPIRRCRGSGTG